MPDKIGRYEISGELGKGAMGVVYQAVDPNIGRQVALKTMRMDVLGADMPDMLKRFQNEARAAGLLNHPNIVTIYDAGEEDGVFYIAMEFIPGKTLAHLLAEVRVLSAEQLVNIGTQICAGLDYAHGKHVIHRDIKPPNIMIAPDGTVKIMDFGIAKAGASMTAAGEVLGTPNYMSPEQVKGKELDGRTDLFSTGVILYEMATGERPFSGQNVTTIIYKIIHETPAPPRELDVTVHPGLSQVIAKCLAKDPEDRYQNGADLAMALRSYKIISVQEPRPVSAPLISPSATGISTRPMQVQPPTALRTGAPATGASAAAAASASKSSPEQTPTEVMKIKPLVVPAKRKSTSVPVVAIVVIAALVLVAGIIGLRRHNANASPEGAPAPPVATTPVAPAESTAEPIEKPPEPVGNFAPKSTEAHASTPKPVPAAGIGSLRITSNPPGAQIEVDGVSQDWYQTPFNTPPMKSGAHTLSAQMAGMPPQTRQIEIVAGQKISVDFQLATDKAIYNIASSPSGADILIDGVFSGRTTPSQLMLTPGQHRIVLRMEGFAIAELTTDAAASQTINLAPALRAQNSTFIGQQGGGTEQPGLGAMGGLRRFYAEGEIPPGMGAMQVRTRPKGVTIMVDNAPIAKLTPFRFPVRPGTHHLTLEKDGFQTVTRTVQVEAGRQLEIDEILPPQR
jgi:serine/threonine-protein kinase